MINFRYHVVSLIAVFLALGVGVLFGSSFIAESTVKALERSQKNLGERNDELRRQIRSLDRSNESLATFSEASLGSVVASQLADRVVLVLSFDSTSRDAVEGVETTLAIAGAKIDGSFVLSTKLDLGTEARRQQVAVATEQQSNDEELVRTQLIKTLTESLSGTQPGFLQRLIDSDLADQRELSSPSDRTAPTLPVRGTALVILSPDPDPRSELEEKLLVPLVAGLTEAGVVQLVGVNGTEQLGLVGLLRARIGLNASTVDGIETVPGRAATILGLKDALAGRYGHFGSGSGATSLLPQQRVSGA